MRTARSKGISVPSARVALPGSMLARAAFVVQFEVPRAELVLHQAAEVADAVDAEVAEEGLGRHQVQVEEVTPLLPAQQRLQHHDDLVGGAAAARAGVGADDGAPAVGGDEARDRLSRGDGLLGR